MLDVSPILVNWAYPLIALVLAGLAGWVMVRSASWLNAHAGFLDAQTREKILNIENQSIQTGVDVVMAQVKALGGSIELAINNPIIRYGAQVAINHASSILKDNGADPDEIAAKILAKLPDNVISTDTTGQTIKTTTVTTETLPAIKG